MGTIKTIEAIGTIKRVQGRATKKVQLFLYSLNDGFRIFDAQTDKRSTKKVQLFLYSLNDGFLQYSLLEGYYWIRMIFICTF